MNIKECLQLLYLELEKAKIENSRLEAELIIGHVLNVDKKYLILNSQEKIKEKDLTKIKLHLKKRLSLYPIAYIKKEKYFYNLKFFVNKNVLIPRPESELIIDELIKSQNNSSEETTIIDIGTGSGCIIISLANILSKNKKNKFYGLDICPKTLKVAKYNAEQNGLNKNISFYKSNLLERIIKLNKKQNNLEKSKVIITANLPYLTKEEIKNSPSIKFEPKKALDGGPDGLKYYEKLLKQIKEIKNKKNHIEIYMEISDWQKNKLILMIKDILKKHKIKIKIIKDLNNKNRIIILKI